ncbi:glycosyl transferase [Metschnikowia bicuspidata]|uniref:Glycosyl transferase n=1 Tax=Metschnikowia bicuspidata TaxID=27322 RepID=A0A4P9ZC06_9ASCO|nr:glycosyl transferase [Metschnikowia bicuspidata]
MKGYAVVVGLLATAVYLHSHQDASPYVFQAPEIASLSSSPLQNILHQLRSTLISHSDADPIISEYGYNPSLAGQQKLSSNSYYDTVFTGRNRTQIGRENATMVMLARNSDLKGALQSMRSLEDRFNRHYRYPWVFLNDVPFDEEFIEQTAAMASGHTFHELIPKVDWEPLPHIDRDKLAQNIANSQHIIYGFSYSYRNMCHFNLGYFYRQKRLQDYAWYFRVEPDVEYMCDFMYDPFTVLRASNKTYGFTIAILEYENTIPTLWDTVEGFMAEYPQHLHPNNAIDFITTNDSFFHTVATSTSRYNMCHFWSNFEIANLDFFRSQAYADYFNYLDQAGGFYYERWGDAPVHSIAVSLLLDKNAIHHFDDIGYHHAPYMSCPHSDELRAIKRCICRKKDEENVKGMDVAPPSCLPRWWRYGSGKRFLNEHEYQF